MAKQKIIELMPPAALEPRPNDVPLTMEQFLKLGFFTRLKKRPSPDKFPGTLALRRFRKGEEICRQGEAGWTAFWTLPNADALAMLREQLASATDPRTKRGLEEEIDALQKRHAAQEGTPEQDPARAVATVYLAIPRPQDATPGLIGRLAGLLRPGQAAPQRPLFVPIDGPTDVNYATLQAPIWEGDIFGEMSCMYGSPRSATIVADCDCYALEMLRNILDKAKGDAGFNEEMDRTYRKRVLQTHLQGLPIFRELTDAQFNAIRDRLELLRCEDGEIICKEGDPSDCMYIIRSGLVKVVKNYQAPQAGPEIIAAYCSKGEFIGEIGLMTGAPRNATCIAYVHPEPPGPKQAGVVWRREAKQVELVRIPKDVFDEMKQSSPRIQRQVEKVAQQRQQQNLARSSLRPWDALRSLIPLKRADEMGLVQGQRLMLIDLDRCTRCDECVQACVDTHADQRSRLFLDGPRFGRYLVPSTCRACLDPVCMIGCPVGAIHRGDNKQIVIEDWCIGCEVCAKNCPYGSIQMHDIGILPPHTHDWRYQSADAVAGEGWTAPGFADVGWQRGAPPFLYDRGFRESLQREQDSDPPVALCFRHTFSLDRALLKQVREFRLSITSTDAQPELWVNGQKQEITEELERDKERNTVIPYRLAAGGVLQANRNVLAVRLKPTPGSDKVLFALRLDEVRPPVIPPGLAGEFSEKPVTALAVVCDLCSEQWGQRPACVTACPHDAAIRVEARAVFLGR